MKEQDPVFQYLSRPENLSVALDIERALADWDTVPHDATSKSINDVFSSEDNLAVARAISQRIKAIQDSFLIKFWPALHVNLKNRLQNSKHTSRWELHISNEGKWTRPYSTCMLYQVRGESKNNAPYLHLEIQQAESFNLNFGVARGEDRKQRPQYWSLNEVIQIRRILKSKKFREGTWWLGYACNYNVRDDAFVLSMAGRSDELIEDITSGFWEVFETTREMIEQANQAILDLYLHHPN